VEAARKVDYVGAGTVEFLYDGADGVYFMEMNTRLQVEHPVTEEITGQDLVEWQLRVAAGEKLPLSQEELSVEGHAVEARLYAEEPYQNYLPQTGRLLAFDAFEEDYGLRVDTGVEAGDAITSFYDPMIAKVIAWRETREEACDALAVGLASLEFKGFGTNRDQLVRILQDSGFAESVPTTKFLPDRPELLAPAELSDLELTAAAVFCHLDDDFAITTIFAETLGFRLNAPSAVTYVLENQGEPVPVTLRSGAEGLTAEIGERTVSFAVTEPEEGVARITLGDQTLDLYAGRDDAEGEGGVALETSVGVFYVRRHDPFEGAGAADGAEAALSSPMPATVTNVLVAEGDEVEAGQPLLTLEAMKMETVIKAPHGGKVAKLHFQKGDSVAKGALLLDLEEESS
jgi:3-methylcrotonyl-CoA carboxylase alpha subunit